LGLVGENYIFKGTTDGFDNLPGQSADNQNMLLDAAFIINFDGAIDGGLSADWVADLMVGGGAHAGPLTGGQNNRIARSAGAHVYRPFKRHCIELK
jgi:hypothetical protein